MDFFAAIDAPEEALCRARPIPLTDQVRLDRNRIYDQLPVTPR